MPEITSGSVKLGPFDDDKDDLYLRKRNHLLNIMKKQNWDEEDKPLNNRGRKPKIKQTIKDTNPVKLINKSNKFFKF